jgi:hypothetical protein
MRFSSHTLEQNQSKRALDEGLRGGFYFHPSDEDLSPGTPVTTPASKDRSLGTPVRKKPLDGCASGYSYSGFAPTKPLPMSGFFIEKNPPGKMLVTRYLLENRI